MNFSIGPVRVQATFAKHPGICVGYRLFTRKGSIAYFPDTETSLAGAPPARGGVAADAPAPAFAQGEDRNMIEFLRGTDLLIMDTQYDTEEYKRHTGWGHGCLDDVVALALQAEVKMLYLFHHDPDHDDAKVSQMLAQARDFVAARNGKLHVEAAREGTTVELPAAVRA
jgi:phosphoribosyl 1,2-cyclic phosphodiesterase